MTFARSHRSLTTRRNPIFKQPLPRSSDRNHRPARRTSNTIDTRALSNNTDKDMFALLAKLQAEKTRVDSSIQTLEVDLKTMSRSRPNKNTVRMLVALQETLQEDVLALRHELDAYNTVDPHCVEKRREEIEANKLEAERWTNNIDIVESWLSKALGTDAEGMDHLRRECYGAEYTEGEGLEKL
ncbi:MAG: hypothetical protein LQ338_007494 [Usnochroma carphineum]|nr:MAG: hypothetical protein LQ338_007494 [Usnochroma carphineum]